MLKYNLENRERKKKKQLDEFYFNQNIENKLLISRIDK